MTDTASRTAGRTRGRDAAPARTAARPPRQPWRRRIRRWLNDQGDWVLVALAIIFLVAYAWPILDTHLNPALHRACQIGQWGAWAGFALDYFTRVWAARDRRRYFTKHLLDLAIVVLPVLGPLRLVRLVVLFRVVNRKAAASMRGHVASYVTISAAALIFCASLAVLNAERQAPASAHANILTFGDALWWAVVTVTTVGYGDHFPVTVEGRFIAVGLMIGGVALIGVVTASFAAWFIGRVRVEEDEARAATQRDLDQITDRLDVVTKELVALRKLNEQQNERTAPP
jgi:voltage-gated potassium channel